MLSDAGILNHPPPFVAGRGAPPASTRSQASPELNSTDINPSAPLPSSAGPSTKKRQSTTDSSKRKRERTSMSATPSDGNNDETMVPQTKEKKKKASRACCHCQKAHLTCDDARPCQRCIKRGMADTCAEGHRKKAKYLLDDEELEALKKAKEAGKSVDIVYTPPPPHQHPQLPPPHDTPESVSQPPPSATSNTFLSPTLFPSSDPLFNLDFNHSYPFDSTAANMEYSMLSAILGNPSAQDDAMAVPPSPPPSTVMANLPMMSNSSWPSLPLDMNSLSSGQSKTEPVYFDPNGQQLPAGALNPASALQFRLGDSAIAPLTPPASDPTPASPALVSPDIQARAAPGPSGTQSLSRRERSALVYTNVDKPFDYVDGYHYLMQYMQGRFDKMDILRIVRALAIFRPSLIALQMDLSPEDEVFAEKCFQRTLIELEKLISFSGTPTVVWRRTGEICLVGVEFAMLTDWSQDDLLKKRKFIYELMEHQSVVEYWEKFASHAFESSSQSVNCHCVLLKPSGEPIPCAFCFSIRRDVFDLPNVIIGQWLPLL